MKVIGTEKKSLKSVLDKINSTTKQVKDLFDLYDLISNESTSDDDWKDFDKEFSVAKKDVENLYEETLYSGENDNEPALVELHSGAGGEEAQDWTDMLKRMYVGFAEKNGLEVKILDYLYGDGAGYKSVTMLFEGEHAYGNLKCERGVHRLVRISPFDANSRRHTSFASLEVMPEIEDAPDIVIRPEDLKVDTFRSSGAGGQHVNKTESAIRITHIPSGIIVACQTERSQIQNRETAMKMLYSKLVEKQELEELEKLASIRGDVKKIEWGSQIRSYVFCPYTMVKDHRTNFETSDVQAVMNGDIQDFINEYLKRTSVKNS